MKNQNGQNQRSCVAERNVVLRLNDSGLLKGLSRAAADCQRMTEQLAAREPLSFSERESIRIDGIFMAGFVHQQEALREALTDCTAAGRHRSQDLRARMGLAVR